MQQQSGPTDIQRRTERRQVAELNKLSAIEAQKTAAAGRRTRGRASLISGSERGITSPNEQAQFTAANVANRPIAEEKAQRLAAESASLIASQEYAASAPERDAAAKRKKDFKTRDNIRDVMNPGLAGTANVLGVKF